MSKGAPKTQTITEKSESEPWKGAQPALLTAMGGAQDLFAKGMPAFYPGSTVAPMSVDTRAGLNAVRGNASTAPAMAHQAWSTATTAMAPAPVAGTGRMTATAQGANANPWSGYFASQSNQGNPFLGTFAATAAAPVGGAGMDTLTAAARGDMMSNPWLDATFNRGADQMRNQLDAAFMRSGRGFNNANYADAFTRGMSDFAIDLYGGAYETDMARRMGAASQLAGYEQGGVDRMLGALGSEATLFSDTRQQNLGAAQFGAGLFDQDLSRSIDAYLGLANQQNAQTGLGLQAADMLPGIYDFAGQGARDLMGVGAALEGYDQAQIDADMARYNYEAFAPRTNVEWLNAIASGAGQLGGTQVSSGQQPYQASNPFLQAAGAATSIAGIAKALPIIFASDRRLKRDAALIGVDDDGNRIWRYAYIWDRPGVERVGVMADEVDPTLVFKHPSGFDMVNYGGL